MFQHAETDPSLDKETFERIAPPLRIELLQRQYELLDKRDRTLLLVVTGIDGAGKGSAINLLNEWMDPRHIHTLAFAEPEGEEAHRPPLWRYWNALPPRGQIGVVFGSWYADLAREAYRRHPRPARLAALREDILRFEALLASEQVQIVKLCYHLSAEAQARRIDAQLADPATAWRVSKADLQVRKRFPRLREAGERVVQATHTRHAPWQVIPSADPDLRAVATAQAVLGALKQRPLLPARDTRPRATQRLDTPQQPGLAPDTALAGRPDDDGPLAALQGRIAAAVRRKRFAHRSLVLVFEGVDAAGKGGAIRRVTHALDVRQFDIFPVSAPTDEERARPYLWRFWRRAPAHGRIAIFDRSWYGRVLVERVESLVAPAGWRRAFDEINDFETQLDASGAIVIKFWLAVSRDEQLARFRARRASPFKRFKLTPDDWRNRDKWDDYMRAAQDMLARTDTPHAPWHVIATDDKRLARQQILAHIAETLETRLRKA